MKATIFTESGPVLLNTDYLRSVDNKYSYFYVPNEAMNADLFKHVGEVITSIRRCDSDWQVQVETASITWED